MKNLILLCAILICTGCNTNPETENISVENKKLQEVQEGKFTLRSEILDQDRTYHVRLPEGYLDASKEKKYPLIILLDGETFLKTTEEVVHFMSSDRNRNHLMPASIIVAVENIDREHDLTVTKIKTKRENTMGGGRDFLDFIQDELLPHIRSNYNTESQTTLIGHSLGGLLTLNAYIHENSIFDSYLAIDPSVFWEEEMMRSKVDTVTQKALQKKLYIATANQGEGNHGKNKIRHDALYAMLKAKAKDTMRLSIQYFNNENHRSVPLKALYEGLRFLNQG